MDVEKTSLSGVLIVTPRRHGDSRGFFSEVYHLDRYKDLGIDTDFVQDNHSLSRPAGTIRGLHYQRPPHAQAKLVRCGAGRVLDVAVDIRKDSPTYGQHVAVELSADNGKQLYIPEGFLHGFSTLTEDAELLYKCSDVYAPDCDGSVDPLSPTLGIDWQVDILTAVMSDKDRDAVAFDLFETPF